MEEPPMSDVKTSTLWRCAEARWVDTDPSCDCLALTMLGAGTTFAVVISGPKGMTSNDFIPAVQAAAAALIITCGGDPSVVGASTSQNDPTFDTGSQRAN
jgi:hypothetical protein